MKTKLKTLLATLLILSLLASCYKQEPQFVDGGSNIVNFDDEMAEFISNFPTIFQEENNLDVIDRIFLNVDDKLSIPNYSSAVFKAKSFYDFELYQLEPEEFPVIVFHISLYDGGYHCLYKYIDGEFKLLTFLECPAFYTDSLGRLTCFEGSEYISQGTRYSYLNFSDNKLFQHTVYSHLWNDISFNHINDDGINYNISPFNNAKILDPSITEILPLPKQHIIEKAKILSDEKLTQAKAATSPLVLLNGKIINTTKEIQLKNEIPYISIPDYEKLFNATITLDNDKITIINQQYVKKLTINDINAIFQGEPEILLETAQIISNEIMLPLSLVSYDDTNFAFYDKQFNITYIIAPDNNNLH